jgi:glutamate formiminotransferase
MLLLCRRVNQSGALLQPLRAFATSTKSMLDARSQPQILVANVYVSEGQNLELLERSSRAGDCAAPAASVCHVFRDEKYHRTGFTIAGIAPAVSTAVRSLTTEALEEIDLREHVRVTHPRIGSVDHIVFHPLAGSSDLELAAVTAIQLAQEVGIKCNVPVYLYGAAHKSRRQLADLRRSLGYFRGAKDGVWSGAPAPLSQLSQQQVPAPDYGSFDGFEKSGAICVGATPWVVNYNVPLITDDMDSARQIARMVSERGGGIPQVQAMALPHSHGVIEVACNLLNNVSATPAVVQAFIEEKAAGKGIEVRQGYSTGLDPEAILAGALERINLLR